MEWNGDRKWGDVINDDKQATSYTFFKHMNNSAYNKVQKCILLNNQWIVHIIIGKTIELKYYASEVMFQYKIFGMKFSYEF